MLRISRILWILLSGAFVGPSFVSTSELKDDIAIVRICNATNSVDLGIFNAYMMHHDLASLEGHSRELSCFLLCIYNEYKWMDRHGNFKLHKIKSWMHRANLTLNDREIFLHKCITIADITDPCARARHFTECFWSSSLGHGSPDDEKHTLSSRIRKIRAL